MDFVELQKYFKSIEYIEDPNVAIKKIVNSSKDSDLIAIIGTHYWGDSIKSFFNICFDNI